MKRINYRTPLTYEERKKIETLVKSGLSCGKIAEAINRSKNAVVVEVRRNGKEDYNAKLAHAEAKKRNDKKIKSTAVVNIEYNQINLKARLESLEMQVGILHTTLKQLKDLIK